SLGFLAIALKQVQNQFQERLVPLMGVCAAFIFAAQMINFPIPGGTSGHLLGGTLAGILLGPWAGSLVLSVVFIVQALFFHDGGILALGANILNIGVVATFGSYYLYKFLRLWFGRNRWQGMAWATAIAAWVSVMMAALLTAVELALSGTVPWVMGLMALLGWHSLIGIGESLITLFAVQYIWRSRPELLYDPPRLWKQI
ncbi:MAG: energy-coupling factor ABC transporter permease, partial [Merismopediaceae bacterium]|nr:energy-coupling factor ABC transporter permease [Merismopediaceae bacterium]